MNSLGKFLIVAAQSLVLLGLIACARLGTPEGWSSPTISGDVLYIGTREGDIRAIDLDSGAAIWKFQLKSAPVYGTPVISGNQLFASGYGGYLYRFNLHVWEAGSTDDDGKIAINLPTDITAFRIKAKSGHRVGQFSVRYEDDGTVQFEASDRNLVVNLVNPQPGGSATVTVTEPVSNDPVPGATVSIDGLDRNTWTKRVGTGAPILGGPIVSDGMVMVGSSDGNMYAYDPEDPLRKWTFHTEGEIWSTPVISDGIVYFGSLDHNIYAVQVSDGTEIWRFPAKGAVTASPVIIGDLAYVGSFDSVFYALDAKTGQNMWNFDDASKWFWGNAVGTDDMVLAPSLDSKLYALDLLEPSLQWSYDVGSPIIGSPTIVGDMVAVPSRDYGIFLLKIRDAEFQDQCALDGKLRASLATQDKFIYLSANDHSIRALRVNSAGNLDEEWTHFTGEEDSLQSRWKCK